MFQVILGRLRVLSKRIRMEAVAGYRYFPG